MIEVISVPDTVDDLVALTRMALQFGLIDRTGPFHADQKTPESDSDHTVHVGWLACSIAAKFFPNLDLGMVAIYSLVHDSTEIFAGDVPTLMGLTPEQQAEKSIREEHALQLLETTTKGLAWLARMTQRYETGSSKEARFVRAVDKIAPKLVHIIDQCEQLVRDGRSIEEWTARLERQRNVEIASYLDPEFDLLYDIHIEIGKRTVAILRKRTMNESATRD